MVLPWSWQLVLRCNHAVLCAVLSVLGHTVYDPSLQNTAELHPDTTTTVHQSTLHHNYSTPENTRKQQCNPTTTILPNGTVHHNCNVPIHTPTAHPETRQKTFRWKIKFYQVNYRFESTVFFCQLTSYRILCFRSNWGKWEETESIGYMYIRG